MWTLWKKKTNAVEDVPYVIELIKVTGDDGKLYGYMGHFEYNRLEDKYGDNVKFYKRIVSMVKTSRFSHHAYELVSDKKYEIGVDLVDIDEQIRNNAISKLTRDERRVLRV